MKSISFIIFLFCQRLIIDDIWNYCRSDKHSVSMFVSSVEWSTKSRSIVFLQREIDFDNRTCLSAFSCYYGRIVCLGGLVSEYFVLTSASCVVRKDGQPYAPARIKVRRAFSGRETAVDSSVADIIVHPRFTFWRCKYPKYDIAILKLLSRIDPGKSSVQPIPFASSHFLNYFSVNHDCYTFGIRNLETEIDARTRIPIVNLKRFDECPELLGRDRAEGVVCMQRYGTPSGCDARFGSPVICKETLVGIISRVCRCSSYNTYQQVTDVGYFHYWIQENLDIYGGTTVYIAYVKWRVFVVIVVCTIVLIFVVINLCLL